MEPDDTQPAGEPDEASIPLQDLLGIGADASPAPPGPDDLRAIVSRAGRRRRRVTAAGVAAALAAGAAIGYGVSNHGSSSLQTASSANSSSSTTVAGYGSVSAGSGIGAAAPSIAPLQSPTLTPIFNRTTAGITIRGFLSNMSLPRMSALPQCGIFFGPSLRAEVSTAKMVGLAAGGFGPEPAASSTVETVGADLLGVAEGDPTAVVTVQTSSAVTRVQMEFTGGGSDEMAPVKGWAALAASAPGLAGKADSTGTPPAVGQLIAYNAAGHQLSTTSVRLGYQMPGGAIGNIAGGAGRAITARPACGICPPPVPKLLPGAAVGSSVNPGGPVITATTIPTKKAASGDGAVSSYACTGVKYAGGGTASSGNATVPGSSVGSPPMTGTVVPATGAGGTSVTDTTAPSSTTAANR
jgi:hypothetical protein